MNSIISVYTGHDGSGRPLLVTYERDRENRHLVYTRKKRNGHDAFEIMDIAERACPQYAQMKFAQVLANECAAEDSPVPYMRDFERVGYAMQHAGEYYGADCFAPSEGGSIAVIVKDRTIGEIYVTGEGEIFLHITGEA